MLDDLTSMVLDHLSTSQSTDIITNSIRVNYMKENASVISNQMSIDNSKIIVPSMCDLLSNTISGNKTCADKTVSQKV